MQREKLELEFSNGQTRSYTRLITHGLGAVIIVPMLDEKTVLLAREYACGLHHYELGLPKGRVERGESRLEAANREMKEEIGYGARDLREINAFSLAPGYMTHVTHIILARDLYPERLQLHFVFSQEEQEFEIAGGRLDAEKIGELLRLFCGGVDIDAAWVCGPGAMIETATAALVDFGMAPDAVHAERFGAPRRSAESPDAPPVETGERTEVTVIMDGHRKTFAMPRSGSSIVDAAAAQGVELPYSCKGGVCATCRTHLRKGEVTMAVNYGLEPWEVEQGFVLACQSTPLSDEILLDYDKS